MFAEEFVDFLKVSPTVFHAVDQVKKSLKGFELLQECDHWDLKPGGKYVVTRNNSAVLAFTMPDGDFHSFQIVSAHGDSPTFRIKEKAELQVRNKYIQLNVERYGGMILSSWFDRPLSVAGRVMVRTDHGVSTRLVALDQDVCIIPNVAIHMNRALNDGYKYNPAVDLMPLWGSIGTKGSFDRMIAEAAGAQEKDVLGTDLYLWNRSPGHIWGQNGEYISAGRVDDMECAWSGMKALLEAGVPDGHVNVLVIFDNEEVGSTTKQGAHSTFMNDVLTRISIAMGHTVEDHYCSLAGSFMISADNAHAVHPNHPELSDPVNQVYMNEGVVLKYNANQKYTTDGMSAAVFHSICEKYQVPVQHFANRSDIVGGTTLGNISVSQVSINTLDIGAAQISMHSCYETAGTMDLDYLERCMEGFYKADIGTSGDGEYSIRY